MVLSHLQIDMKEYTFPLLTLFDDIRVFIYGGIRLLPLTIAGFFLIFGLMTANYAMMIFLFAFAILVPILASLLNFTIDVLKSFNIIPVNYFMAKSCDLCPPVIPFVDNNFSPIEEKSGTSFTTTWLSMIVFFMSYMLTNAIVLYRIPPPKNQPSKSVTRRKTQAFISVILTSLLSIVILISRFYSGCESCAGMGLTIVIFGYIGYLWYNLASSMGQNRLSDLFGISNRMLTPQVLYGKGVACFPVKKT